jgi:tetratricopeptide (TPR) repeat protein
MIEDDLAKGGTHNHVLDSLDKALEIDPNDVKALAQYVIISALHLSFSNRVAPGSVSAHASEYLKTSERIERGLKKGEQLYKFFVARGILLDEIGKHSEARHWFREVGKIQPFIFPFWRMLTATSFGKERDYTNALLELEHALDEGASGPSFDFYYARALGSVGNYDLAIARLEKVRSLRGNYYQLVDLLRSSHHFAWHPMKSAYFAFLSAVYVFRKSKLRSLVHMRDSLLSLGLPIVMRSFTTTEKLARKLPLLRGSKLARLTDPGNPYVSLGMSLISSGNYLAAQKQFVKASMHSDRLNTWMNLCSASLKVSDWRQAQRAYSYLIERWPEEIPTGYGEAISEGLSGQSAITDNL